MLLDDDGALAAEFLAARGSCCDTGCRNCPYPGEENGGEALAGKPPVAPALAVAPAKKVCGKCGKGFECCSSGCWCEGIRLSEGTLKWLRRAYADCLCPECLKEYEGGWESGIDEHPPLQRGSIPHRLFTPKRIPSSRKIYARRHLAGIRLAHRIGAAPMWSDHSIWKDHAMNTTEVGQKLVELCRKGENLKAQETLYDKNIVSVEPMAMPPMPAESKGYEAVKKKSEWWMNNHEVHSAKAEGPFVAGDKFVVFFDYDVTNKPSGKRMKMSEAGVYTVANGKVVREEFYYHV
jgi:ketosteroid isomerase-like protein